MIAVCGRGDYVKKLPCCRYEPQRPGQLGSDCQSPFPIARFVEFCHMSSGWFDHTEPSLSTSLQGKQGVQGAYA